MAWVILIAAILLAIERITYVWIWHRPSQFATLCERFGGGVDPVEGLVWLFRTFKVIQIGVFVGWSLWWDGGALRLHGTDPAPLAAAIVLIAVGQALNYAVFRRIGRIGVFYGVRFGHEVPWCDEFPFTVLSHPQYVGTVLSIWGVFLLVRFPQPDWWILPLLETAYYTLGARYESD